MIRTEGIWFGSRSLPLCGWWSQPAGDTSHGVLVAPALGYQYGSAYVPVAGRRQ
ncbi:MAG TPA: hypothetical protein VFN09_10250 [Rhodanobacteraceae bacterium]|nr:hypothetical protein [Rhodanobacteraceae bacterium]